MQRWVRERGEEERRRRCKASNGLFMHTARRVRSTQSLEVHRVRTKRLLGLSQAVHSCFISSSFVFTRALQKLKSEFKTKNSGR